MATVSATFAVAGSTYREIKMDTDGMAVDEIADALEQQVDDPSFCHQCSSECEDPALEEMTSVAVDGVEYVYGETGWRRTDEPRPAPKPLRQLPAAPGGCRAPAR